MLIQRAKEQFNVPVSVLCRRFDMPRASFYRTGRKEDSDLLEVIKSVYEAQQRIREWVRSYNTDRPHAALGYRTPMDVWNEYH